MKQKITDEQFIQEREEGLTLKQIAEKYGMNVRTVEARSSKLAKSGHGHGSSHVAKHVPEGYLVKGTSTMIRANGEEVVRWVKSAIDADKMEEQLNAIADAFADDIDPVEPVPAIPQDHSETLALYPVFDLHIGALAHKHECGESYDTNAAEQTMTRFFDYAVEASPNSRRAVLLIGGDFLHSDGLDAVTPASGHVLDQDSRYAKLVYVAIRSLRRSVAKMLTKHEQIDIEIIEGNHDQASMVCLRAAIAAFYEDEPRVKVNTSPAIMHVVQFGKTLLGFTHGHTMKKPESRLSALAVDHAEKWGSSRYRYTHSGHFHHVTVTEHSLGIDEVHGALAAKDAYSARGGWRSYRQAAVIIYSPEFGEIGRHIYKPGM